MRIAHIILCHRDPVHIGRLSKRLSKFSDVFIHVDKRINIDQFLKEIDGVENIHFLKKRYKCGWESYNVINATIELLSSALNTNYYERLVFLQGADYPFRTDAEIIRYFEENREVEFIRGCKCSDSEIPYFHKKQYGRYITEHTRVLGWFNQTIDYIFEKNPKAKPFLGYAKTVNQKYDIYWGSAQFAITGELAKYFVDFHKKHFFFNLQFRFRFPVDELYFTTIFYGSPFSGKNKCGVDKCEAALVSHRNLHYFEYPRQIRIWKEDDYEYLINHVTDELYIRKVDSEQSVKLLDKLDSQNKCLL